MDRIAQLLEPEYLVGIDARPLDDLRAMRSRCAEFELSVSYDRRIVQARMEILDAEVDRRARGGGLDELVADLPRILGAEPGRAAASSTRVANAQAPSIQLKWPDGRESLVADETLANLPLLTDDDVRDTVVRLREFEQELSEVRRRLHGVIDALDREIAARQVAGSS